MGSIPITRSNTGAAFLNKTLRIVLVAFGVLALGLVAAAIALVLLVDPNDYKEEIVQAARQQTGRDLKVEGRLKLSLFPWLGIESGGLELANAPGFGKQPFARVDAVVLRVRLLPLLRKELVIDTIVLDGLELNLMRNKAGVSNWDDLAGAAPPPGQKPPATDGPAAPAIAALSIGGIRVNKGKILWLDQRAGQRYVVQALTLKSGKIVPGEAIDLDMGFDIEVGDPPQRLRVALATRAALDLAKQSLDVPSLALSVDELTLKGGLQARQITEAPLAEGRIDVGAFDPKPLMAKFGIEPPRGIGKIALQSAFKVDIAKETLALSDLVLTADELKLSADLRAQQILKAPRASGRIELAPFAPQALMKRLGLEYGTTDRNALAKLGLKTGFDASEAHLALSELDAMLDESRLRGAVSIRNFARPSYAFDLTLSQIDLDRYLPPSSAPSATTPATGGAATALPLDALRALNAQGQVRIAELKAFGIRSANVTARIKAESGVITLGPNQAALYGGRYDGTTTSDARGSTPRFHIKEKLSGVQVGPFLTDANISDQLTGTGDLALDVTASGLEADALLKTMTGSLSIDVRDGELKGIDLQQEVNNIQAWMEKARREQPSLKPKATDATKYDRFKASFKLANGIASNSDLDLRGPLLLAGKKQGGIFATGNGMADLLKQTVQYRVNVRIAEDIARAGTILPIDVSGTLAEPVFRPDWGAILKAQVDKRLDQKKEEQQQAIEQKKEEKKQELEDRLREKLRRKLR